MEQKLISDCRYRVTEISSLASVLFREVFSHPYISFFHLLVNGFVLLVSVHVLANLCVMHCGHIIHTLHFISLEKVFGFYFCHFFLLIKLQCCLVNKN